MSFTGNTVGKLGWGDCQVIERGMDGGGNETENEEMEDGLRSMDQYNMSMRVGAKNSGRERYSKVWAGWGTTWGCDRTL